MEDSVLDLDTFRAARAMLPSYLRVTPVIQAKTLGGKIGKRLFLKAENLQRTGTFKSRGPGLLIPELRAANPDLPGVCTASAGNHAQGVAIAAQVCGLPAFIVMPESAPLTKIDRTRKYGATIVLHGATFHEAQTYALEFALDRGLEYIPPFDHERIIAGQATVGLELLEQCTDVEAIVVPVGGGGLLAGVAAAVKLACAADGRTPVAVYGVCAAAAPSARESLIAGSVREVPTTHTIADGIRVRQVGERTFPLIREYADRIVAVDETAIADAIVELWHFSKLTVEGAGAAPVAALASGALEIPERTVVCVLSGGNIDLELFHRLIGEYLERNHGAPRA